ESRSTDSAEFSAIPTHRRSYGQSEPGASVQSHEANVTLVVRPHVLGLRHAEQGRRVNSTAGPVAQEQCTTAALGTKRWLQVIGSPLATEPSPQGRGAGRALSESNNLLQTPKARKLSQSRTRAPQAVPLARMRLAPIQEKGRGGRRSSMPRSAHPSATIFGFGTAKHEKT